jgi:hypothetical protein
MHRYLHRATFALLAALAFDAAAAPCPTTNLTPATALPGATVGINYSQSFTASNSNALPFKFVVTSGLPSGTGLMLASTSTTTADLAGVPALAGSWLVTIAANDTLGCGGGRTYALAVAQGAQTIEFTTTAPAGAAIGGAAYEVAASATSGLPVTFAIAAASSGVCSLAGTSVSFQAPGNCTINANQAGDANWAAAPQAQQSFAVGQGAQTIAFTSTAPVDATVNGATYAVSATATSGLPVTLAIDAASSSVCALAGGTVSFTGAGTCVINANQAGNANWAAAPQAQQTFAVSRASQTITYTSTAPAAATVGGPTYTVTATATSGLPVTFAIDAASSAICSLAGSTVSFTGNGVCTINANQAGNATWNPAPQAQQFVAVGAGNQTITFTSTAPAAATFNGATYTVSATASSGLAVTFAIDAASSAVCSIAGSTVSFTGAGTCVINANQAGNGSWNAAPQAQQSFAVAKASQTVTFTSTAPAAAAFNGATYTVTATATSGLAVTFAIDAASSSVCSIAGSTVSFTGVGTCTINANQAGNTNWNAATQVQQTFAVAKASQTVTFTSTAPAAAAFNGATYTVTATATSGLAVSFAIDAASSSVCSIAGSTVSFTGVGTCTINANQAGNASWNAAPQAQQSFAVAKASQTVTFTSTAPAAATFSGATYTVTATASSGLPVTFTIDPIASGVCAIAGSTVSFTGVGTCVINANQAGNGNWNAAPQAQQTFAVAKASQTVTFTSTAPAAAVVNGATYTVTATASSGLTATFSIAAGSSGICTIAGSTVSFIGAGTCVINANQGGNTNWNAAPQVQQTFTVGRGNQTIAFTSTAPTDAIPGSPNYTVTATATSGLTVTFSIDASSSTVCSIAGSSVSFLAPGTCRINANQAGDSNWNVAPQAQQTVAVNRRPQTITFVSTAPSDAIFGGATYEVSATASSGLPVDYTIDASASAVCTIAGTTVTFIGAGTCVINANQAGDALWAPAPQAQQSFAVARAAQTITFTSTPPAIGQAGNTYAVTATATSGLPVTFSIDASASGICSVSGGTVTFNAVGLCVINANQAGDTNWAAAPQVQQNVAVTNCLDLAVGQVANGAMPGDASICVANNTAGATEYTYVPMNFATSDTTLSVLSSNVQSVTGPPLPRPGGSGTDVLAPLADAIAPAADADQHAHASESPLGRPIERSDLVKRGARGTTPLAVGDMIDLNAAVGACGVTPSVRKGRVEAVSTNQFAGAQRLYAVQEVEEQPPGSGNWVPIIAGGYQSIDFNNIINALVTPASTVAGAQSTPIGSVDATLTPQLLFTGAADLAATNFGQMTDLDMNGGVIVFFTRTLNELSAPATAGTAGLFQIRDVFAADSCGGSNEGEILYMPVPDPTGVVNSNVRTVGSLYQTAPPALVHNYAHLTNAVRRLYENGATLPEETWLDEGLAYMMQELVFFNASAGIAPRTNVQLSTLTTGPSASVRVRDFNMYENPMFGNLRDFLYQLSSPNGGRRAGPLRTATYSAGTTPSRHDVIQRQYSVTYTFLRYLLDRKNTGDAALLNALVNTTNRGTANLAAVMNVSLEDWGRDFMMAAYTDDAILGGGIAPEYLLLSWNYRSVFGGLGGFPLVTLQLNGATQTFPLGSGGGASYQRFGVAAGQVATISLSQGGVTPSAQIRMAIVRTK